ncbi:MAG: phosphate acyltransferase, partial [Gammaproteobacteria bacterium]
VDVIVCDGFAGNIALKSMEGLAKIIGSVLKKALSKNIFTMMFAMISKPVLGSVRKQLDPARYNGASFIGLRGTVVKSHGGANAIAFGYAIEQAIAEAYHDVPKRIGHELATIFGSNGEANEIREDIGNR